MKNVANSVRLKIMVISPSFAAKLLSHNPNNRSVRPAHVDAMARDMYSGRFQCNGDAIRISESGELLDGQHRLLACVQSGVSFESIVVSGLSDLVKATIDSGAARCHADRLAMRGIQHAAGVSATLRVMAMFAMRSFSIPKLTSQELDIILAAHPGVINSASIAAKVFPLMGSKLTAAHYILQKTQDDDVAAAYISTWKDGVPFYEGCPAHLLRERLIRLSTSSTALKAPDVMNLLAVSINKFARFEGTKVLKPGIDCGVNGWTEAMLWGLPANTQPKTH